MQGADADPIEPRFAAGSDLMIEPGRRQSALERSLFAAVSASALSWCLWLASQHPLGPSVALAACCAWIAVSAKYPGLWLFVLPASLPVASLAPWTGWLIFDEFDLLVAGAVTAEFARMALHRTPPAAPTVRRWILSAMVFAGLGLLGLSRGLCDAGLTPIGMFQGYTNAMNSVRIFKPVIYTLLVLPLLQHALRDADSSALAIERLAGGMLLGLCFVLLAVLRERVAYPGLLDFASPYRTVALFWEMHVGGAAIDAYLALTAPFVAWALWSARSALRWSFAAILALLAEYACLTTFSRGVYLAVIGPLVVLGVYLARHRLRGEAARPAFRAEPACNLALVAAMLLQAALVLGSDSFMLGRIGASERDLRSRLAHWQQGLSLLETPADWVLGTGLGRLPSHYAATASGGEFPGSVELVAEQNNRFVRLAGPRSQPALGGLYGLTQRVPIEASALRLVSFDVRTAQATRLRLSVCEMHLLYERRCQSAQAQVEPTEGAWRPVSIRLDGTPLTPGAWYARRTSVFSVSVLDANAMVELDNLSLQGADGTEQLQNGNFARQLARWFPVAKNQFLAWHIDNLYLEILIERGIFGLAVFLLLAGVTAWRLAFGPASRFAISPFLLASLSGAMTVGLVSSIMDVPRVAFGLFLVALFSMLLKPE